MFVDLVSGERVFGQGRARDRCAVDGEVNAWVFEQRAQHVVFHIVEAQLKAAHGVVLSAEDVGNAAAFLCSPLAAGITGETLHVDKGYNTMGMPAKALLAEEK